MRWRTAITGLVQSIIAGGVLAVATAHLLVNAEIKAMHTTNNGRTSTLKHGASGNNIFLRAASAKDALAANVAKEAVYWTATVDGAGRTLNGQHDYRLRFLPGGVPPNAASCSPTLLNTRRYMVDNPTNRYGVGERSGLVPGTSMPSPASPTAWRHRPLL